MTNRKSAMKTGWVVAIVAALALPVVAFGGAGGRGHGPGKSFARMVERHAEAIGVDDATVAQIQAIAEREKAGRGELGKTLRSEQAVMDELLAQDQPNESAVLAQADLVGQLRTEMHKQRIRTILEVRALLTPEQRTALAKLRDERRERRHRRHGGFHRGGRDEAPPAEG